MLWRQSYETRILRDVPCPATAVTTLDGSPVTHERQVWIGGFGFDAIADQGVWGRLFRSDFPNDPSIRKAYIFPQVGKEQTATALALVPRSEAGQCMLVEDPNGLWREVIEPNGPSHGFAAIIEIDRISVLMVGPPTEDAWEEFSNRWSART